jgi:hypothetical protein
VRNKNQAMADKLTNGNKARASGVSRRKPTTRPDLGEEE